MMNFKRILAFVLSLCMVLTLAPVSTLAFATENETVASNSGNLMIEELDGNEMDVDLPLLNGNADDMVVEQIIDEDEIVKVLIVMESESVIESDPAATLNASAEQISQLEEEQAEVVAEIEDTVLDGEALEVNYSYTWLLNGVAADVPYGSIKEILAIDGVKQVLLQPVYEVCEVATPNTVTDGVMIGRESTWAAGYTGEGMKIAIIDTGLDTDHPNFAALPEDIAVSADADTVAEVLNNLNAAAIWKGLTAEDVYYNTKVAYGFNYVDANLNITHDYDDRGPHGTHVAGIAAANKIEGVDVVGVAPNAQLYVMKVFGANGGAYTEDILAALEDALLLGADVVNMSLGSPAGFTHDADDMDNIYNRVALTGTVLSISAGNSYNAGFDNAWGLDMSLTSNPDNGVVGQPGVYNNVMSVASVENLAILREYIQVSDGYMMCYTDTGINYGRPSIMSLTGEYEFVFVPNLGTPEDFAQVDVTGKVALVSRGEISFYEKVDNAAAAGAVACIVYNNTDGEFGMDLTDGVSGIPGISIMLADAAYLFDAQQADPTITISFPDEVEAFPSSTAYEMSPFSSWGVAPDLSLEPDITAPGGNIYSTVDGGYGLMSGTSMAAPNVAGLTALVMEHIRETMPELEDTQVRVMAQNLLISTSAPLPYDAETYYSPRQQGSGLANAFNAVTTKGYLTVDGMDVPKVELGDDDAKTGSYSYSFNVHNMGEGKAFYDVSTVIQTEAPADAGGGLYFMYGVPMGVGGVTAANSDAMVLVHDLDENAVTNTHDAYILYRATQGDKADSFASEEFRYDANYSADVTTADVQSYLDALVGNESVTDLEAEALCVAAGETAVVNVSVAVSDDYKAALDYYYPNGIYVEGFTFLDALNEGTVSLSLPYLGFYGDWDKAPILDTGDYWDYVNGEANFSQYLNALFSQFGNDDYGIYPGMNAYVDEPFDVAHISLSPNGDHYLDTVSDIYVSLLRNASELVYSFTDITDPENPEELYSLTVSNVGKTIYSDAYGQIVPEIYSWYDGLVPLYDWKDAEGKDLENNDVILLDIAATGAYEGAHTEHWSVPITIDLEAPQLLSAERTVAEDGSVILTLTFRDNLSCSVVGLVNSNGMQVYAMEAVEDVPEDENGYQNYTASFNITGLTGKLMIILSDYAINESYYGINLGGEGTPYGTLVGYSNSIGLDPGWVSFSEGVNMDETMIFMDSSNVVAAEYVGGYVFAQTDNGALYGFKYEDMLKDTFVLESTFVAQLDNVYQDMAYSYAEGKLYGLLAYSDNDGYPTTELFTINIGEPYYDETMWMEVGAYDEMSMVSRSGLMGLGMAIDDAGTIYVMGNAYKLVYDENDEPNYVPDETASLWTVGLEYDQWADAWMLGWMLEKQGNVAQTMDYLQSMTWDHNTEKLYWARFDAPGWRPVSELYVVDPETVGEDGFIATEKVGDLSGEISGLYAPLSAEAAARDEHLNIPDMDPDEVGTPILRDDVITMNITGTRKLTYDLDPWYTNHKDVVWSSSDEEVVSVDENGVIHALKAGSAVITASNAADESKCDTVEIQVTALDLTIEGIISAQEAGIGQATGVSTYNFTMVDGISQFGTVNRITAPAELNYGLSLATSASGRGSLWACEYGNTGMVYEIDAETGVVKDVLEPIDGDMMFGMSYSESQDTFTGIMNMYIYADLELTHEESEKIMNSYDEAQHNFMYHRINMLPYLRESGGSFMTGETGQGASSEIVFCGITTIEGGEATYLSKDYLGNWSSELNYIPTQTLVLLDNVGRLWFIDEVKNMTLESDDWGNAFYLGEDGSMIDAAYFHGVEAIETSEGVYSVFIIRELAETPLTAMFRDGSMPRITYHFSDIELAGFTADGAPMIIMSLYDYWNNGTTNELYLFIPGVGTGEFTYDENWNYVELKTPDRLYSLGNTGAHNIIASVHFAEVTGGVDDVIDNVQTEEEYVEELGINALIAPAFKGNTAE